MTLIAVWRVEKDLTVGVVDHRVTDRFGDEIYHSDKLDKIDNILVPNGLVFKAGSIKAWNNLKATCAKNNEKISFNNIKNEDGPFLSSVEIKDGEEIGSIVALLDEEGKVHIYKHEGLMIEEIKVGDFYVIGSGYNALKEHLEKSSGKKFLNDISGQIEAKQAMKEYYTNTNLNPRGYLEGDRGKHFYSILRSNIKRALKKESLDEYGISEYLTCFYFDECGGKVMDGTQEIEGWDETGHWKITYTSERNEENTWVVGKNGKKIELETVDDYRPERENNKL